jgi:hypothetical protein
VYVRYRCVSLDLLTPQRIEVNAAALGKVPERLKN